MDEARLYELLKKQEEGTLSAGEKQLLDEWFEGMDLTPGQPLDTERSLVRMWAAITGRIGMQTSIRRVAWMRYAAAAITVGVLVAIGIAKWGGGLEVIRVPQGQVMKLALADGTIVWLNGGAEMSYPTKFGGAREVELRKGEAWFDVAPDAAKPFTVQSGRWHTQVLGTSFDIRADSASYMVGVSSGRVRVSVGSKVLSNELLAGQRLTMAEGAPGPLVESFDKSLFNGWVTRTFVLRNASLREATFCMESLFGVRVTILDSSLTGVHLNTRFSRTDSLQDVLNRCSLAGNFHYTIAQGNRVLIYR